MPVRLESWSVSFGLAPIFEMNLPEGVLRERLRLAFAKATGTFDEFDLLSVVGRSQVGRIRYTGDHERLNEDVPFQSVDEILERKRGGDLFRYLLEKFAHSPASVVCSRNSSCATKEPSLKWSSRDSGSRRATRARPTS